MSDTATFLVPLDLSDCSAKVVDKAAQLAEVNGARVVIVHVVKPVEGVSGQTKIRPEGRESATELANNCALLTLTSSVRAPRWNCWRIKGRPRISPACGWLGSKREARALSPQAHESGGSPRLDPSHPGIADETIPSTEFAEPRRSATGNLNKPATTNHK